MNDLRERLACVLRCLEGYGRAPTNRTDDQRRFYLRVQRARLSSASKRLAEALAEVLEPKEPA